MLPLYPPYPFVDLANESFGRRPDGRPRRHRPLDPDGFLDAGNWLQPDPVFIGLRALMTRGPIGRLVHWVDRWIEIREDRFAREHVVVAANTIAPAERVSHPDAVVDDRTDQKTAA